MSYLVRVVTKKGYWARASEKDVWKKGNFPVEILADLHPKDKGISFFEVHRRNDPDIVRIAVDRFLQRQSLDRIESVEIRIVRVTDVVRIGVRVSVTPGMVIDKALSSLHRDVLIDGGPHVVKLAYALSRRKPLMILADRLVACMVSSVRSGRIPLEWVVKHHNVVKELEKKYHVLSLRHTS
ncbi:MAG: hypothetical protein WD673_02080 [Alphaproteobacteria bacterium]